MKTSELSDGALKVRRQYITAWRRKNPDKLRQYMNTYWQKKYELQRQKITLPDDKGQPRKTADQYELLMP
jgi:hypothetical protein